MLLALPNSAARNSILWWDIQSNMSDPSDSASDHVVAGESTARLLRQLRQAEKFPQKSVQPVPSETNETNAPFSDCQCPITGIRSIATAQKTNQINQFRNSGILQTDKHPCNSKAYSAPVSVVLPPQFIERELVLLYDDARLEVAERVLEYLARAESKELDPWAQDDIRVAWMAVLYAARGYERPWHYAFWCYYGKTVEKAVPIWLEEEAKRETLLGPGLCAGGLIYPPKKLPKSTRQVSVDEECA